MADTIATGNTKHDAEAMTAAIGGTTVTAEDRATDTAVESVSMIDETHRIIVAIGETKVTGATMAGTMITRTVVTTGEVTAIEEAAATVTASMTRIGIVTIGTCDSEVRTDHQVTEAAATFVMTRATKGKTASGTRIEAAGM